MIPIKNAIIKIRLTIKVSKEILYFIKTKRAKREVKTSTKKFSLPIFSPQEEHLPFKKI